MNGSSVFIDGDMSRTFFSISLELGNEELLSFVEEEITLDNVIDIFRIKEEMLVNNENELELIVFHFYELNHEDISTLKASEIDRVLSSDSLVISSEHELFELIQDLITNQNGGYDYRILLRHLNLEYLDVSDVSSFLEYVDQSNIDTLLPLIKNRFIFPLAKLEISKEKATRYQNHFRFKGDKFDGIFSHLWKETKGNPVINGTVSIEMTSFLSGNTNVSNLVDQSSRYQTDWRCAIKEYNMPSFIFDFKDKVVSLNRYSLKAHSEFFSSYHFMTSWVIEGSNDGTTWTLIDEQQNSTSLLSNMAEGNWQCRISQPFRFIRVKMTSKNTKKYYYMTLHAIEFFGSIKIA